MLSLWGYKFYPWPPLVGVGHWYGLDPYGIWCGCGIGCSCSSNSTPALGTSICCWYDHKKEKEKEREGEREKEKKRERKKGRRKERSKEGKKERVLFVAQRNWIWVASMRTQVWSLALLSRLRIWHCPELWCRSQTWLESGVAVAVV